MRLQVRLRPSRRITTNISHDGRLVLTIPKISLRDSGTYRCIASNQVGTAESSAVVRVIPKDEQSTQDDITDIERMAVSETKRDIP